MSGVFSQFRFWSPKLVQNPTPRAVLATSGAKKVAVDFFQSNAPNPRRLTQNSCLVCFRSFGFGLQNRCETRPGGPFWPHEERKKLQLIFSNRTHPIHPVSPKAHVCCVFVVSILATKTRVTPDPEGCSGNMWSEKCCSSFFGSMRSEKSCS